MKTATRRRPTTTTTITDCVHYWQIEPPSGETSEAVCIHCGAERTFENGYDWREWNEKGTATTGL